MPTEAIETLAQLGAAGLMGFLWIWERTHSRQREQQLSDAHKLLMEQRESLQVLCELVRQNTRAIERFEQVQVGLEHVLERISQTINHAA